MASDMGRLFTDKVAKPARRGRIYIDTNRTTFGTSAIGSYSLRATPDFGSAMPLAWQDLHTTALPSEFFRKKALFRLEKRMADPWADFEDARASITAKARKSVGLKE